MLGVLFSFQDQPNKEKLNFLMEEGGVLFALSYITVSAGKSRPRIEREVELTGVSLAICEIPQLLNL